MSTVSSTKNLTEKETNDLLKQILGKSYSSAGDNLPILKKVIGILSDTSDITALIEIIPALNTALTNSKLFIFASSGASIVSILLFPVGTMLAIVDAYQSGIKMYTYRAIAYTITAWAYNKPIPKSSKKILSNSKTNVPASSNKEIQQKNIAWWRASRRVIKNIDDYLVTEKISEDNFKILLQAMSDGSEQKLCRQLLKGFAKKFKDYPSKLVWKSNYSIKYPK